MEGVVENNPFRTECSTSLHSAHCSVVNLYVNSRQLAEETSLMWAERANDLSLGQVCGLVGTTLPQSIFVGWQLIQHNNDRVEEKV